MSNKVNKKNEFVIILDSNSFTRLYEYDTIVSAIMRSHNDKIRNNERIRKNLHEALIQKILNCLSRESDSMRLTFEEFELVREALDKISDKRFRNSWKNIMRNAVSLTADFKSLHLINN
jgi:hypothetical protein